MGSRSGGRTPFQPSVVTRSSSCFHQAHASRQDHRHRHRRLGSPLWKPVVKFVRRYRSTKFKVVLGVKVPNQVYYQSIDSGKTIKVVR
jgi:hypothetical protein